MAELEPRFNRVLRSIGAPERHFLPTWRGEDVQFVDDEFDCASVANSIEARIGGATLPIGPLELQVAYKPFLGTQRDLEDAVHLYTLFGETLRVDRLQAWCTRLGVEDEYDRLERA